MTPFPAWYLRDCLLGASNQVEILRKAEEHGLTDGRLNVLRGFTAFYEGRYTDAIKDLECADHSAATLAALALAKLIVGDGDGFGEAAALLRDTPIITREDHLMVAQLFSIADPERGLRHSKSAGDGILPRIVQATASAGVAVDDGDWDQMQSAVDEVHAARVLYPEHDYVLNHYIHIHHLACRLARALGMQEESDRYRDAALAAADRVTSISDRLTMSRAYLWADVGMYDKALAEFERCLKTPNLYTVNYAIIACLADQQDRAIRHLKGHLNRTPDCVNTKAALGWVYAQSSDTQPEAIKFYHEIVATETSSDAICTACTLC